MNEKAYMELEVFICTLSCLRNRRTDKQYKMDRNGIFYENYNTTKARIEPKTCQHLNGMLNLLARLCATVVESVFGKCLRFGQNFLTNQRISQVSL